jgi:hypothetical protein
MMQLFEDINASTQKAEPTGTLITASFASR